MREAPRAMRQAELVANESHEVFGIAAVVNSFVNYFVYSAASRLHWLTRGREA